MNLSEHLNRIQEIMGKTSPVIVAETQQQDQALDQLSQTGNFQALDDIHKLALWGASGDEANLKSLDLEKIHDQNGQTFGDFQIKVRVLPEGEIVIDDEDSSEFNDEVGWLHPDLLKRSDGEMMVQVRFKSHDADKRFVDITLPVVNVYPIDITDGDADIKRYEDEKQISGMSGWADDEGSDEPTV